MIFVALFGIAALVGLARALGFAGGEPATARGSWLDGGAALAAFGLLVAAAVIAALGNSSSRLPDPVAVATPGFIILVLVEMIAVKAGARGRYDWRDSFASLTLGFGSTMAAVLVGGAVVAAYGWIYRFRLFDVPIAWWSAALCLVLDDLAYYAFHRSAHRVRWFWASHVVHHSSEHYNLTTALRQPWTSAISLSFAFRLPLFLIGFDPRLVLSVAGVNLVYQFWVHTEAVGRLPGWFERLFNTPSHHRVHHGVNARYLDRNYGGVFIVWDRLFGTFAGETEPVRYGLVTNLGSFIRCVRRSASGRRSRATSPPLPTGGRA